MLKFALVACSALAVLASPACAQVDPGLQKTASQVAKAKLTSKPYPVGFNVPNVDAAKSPWVAISSKQAGEGLPESERKRAYSVSANLDWNGDGILDQAFMARNASQIAVMVRLGGNKGQVVAYKAEGQWGGGEEIISAGRRIIVNFPESSMVILTAESGQPTVRYVGD